MHVSLTGESPQSSLRDMAPTIFVVGAMVVACACLAITYGWFVTALPLLVIIGAITFFMPRAGIFLVAASLYLRISIPFWQGKYPADILAILVILGVAVMRMTRGRRPFERTWIAPILLVILAAFGLTLTRAYDLELGFVNWLRHAQLFALILAIASCLKEGDDLRLIHLLLTLTAIVSMRNILVFLASGGNMRVFGIAGPFFALYTVIACLHASVGYLTARRLAHRVGWGCLFLLYFGALIATQTRAALLQLSFGFALLVAVVWFWSTARREHLIRHRVVQLVMTLAVVLVIVVSGVFPFLHHPSDRIINAFEGHAVTVEYRLFLWRLGLQAFLKSPFLGVGLQQVSQWDKFLPQWRFDPMASHTRGLGAHNDFISYLAETGLVGTFAIGWLFWALIRSGARGLIRARRVEELTHCLHLWAPIAAIIIGYFFSPHMFYSLAGMVTALYVGAWVRYTLQHRTNATAAG